MPNVPNKLLSDTQARALDVYRRWTDRHDGSPPSVRELAAELGITHNGAHYLIGKLREKGYLTMKPVTIIRPTLTAKARKK